MKDDNIPVIGNIYYHFDDGKISLSRREEVAILDVIPFSKIDQEGIIYNRWREELKSDPYFYTYNTDYFVIGHNLTHPNMGLTCYVRTTTNGWYGFMIDDNVFWGNQGLLDVDGSLLQKLDEYLIDNKI